MESPFPTDEASVRHRFDRLCQMSLKGEAINYYKHMDNRRKHEITFSELSDDELRKLKTVDKYFYENEHFTVLGYDVEVKNELLAEALKDLTDRRRNVVLQEETLIAYMTLRQAASSQRAYMRVGRQAEVRR